MMVLVPCVKLSGVVTTILAEEAGALYMHCYGHSINLAAYDAIRGTKLMKNIMETAHEITKLIKYSPCCQEIFYALKALSSNHLGPGLHVLFMSNNLDCLCSFSGISRGTVVPLKYGVGIGLVQNGVLYLRYGSSFRINTVKRCKTLIDENP